MKFKVYFIYVHKIPKDLRLEKPSTHYLQLYDSEKLALEHLTKIHEKVLSSDSVKLIHRDPNTVRYLVTKDSFSYKVGDELIYSFLEMNVTDECDSIDYILH